MTWTGDAGLAVAEDAGILAEQATLPMAIAAMPAWRSHRGSRVPKEESGAEKAEDMREKDRGRRKECLQPRRQNEPCRH
ncbi:MAG: hypothetical protein E2583_17915 [Comamonas sp.]|nr:hypothetical protein [Comamonas sp.]